MQATTISETGRYNFHHKTNSEKYIKKCRNLYFALVDLQKALIGFIEWFSGGPYRKLDYANRLCV